MTNEEKILREIAELTSKYVNKYGYAVSKEKSTDKYVYVLLGYTQALVELRTKLEEKYGIEIPAEYFPE
ncbi:hypothetical protein M0R19_05055 [Candidatus Pacearchaeota archaeon]|jgi:hypothetical protein|nr:hypothetical protein [Candidatus Pacearchaeota archaeon]